MTQFFSLIIATYGRYESLEKLLQSIKQQNYDLSFVEVYVVDQNDKIDLSYLLQQYQQFFLLHHIKSKIKGLSCNRNLALKKIKGDIIAFPDDDCCYYPDTLITVNNFYLENPQTDCVLGKIYSRKCKRNIIRNWGNKEIRIGYRNFYFNYSSITIFTKKNDVNFSEKLGVGTVFGSYEDADYIAQLLDKKKNIVYFPKIHVWHPELNINVMEGKKIYSYGLGFGALCKKHLNIYMGVLFIGSIIVHFFMYIIATLNLDKMGMRKRGNAIISRLKGFFLWEN